jgi:hypothetical protein
VPSDDLSWTDGLTTLEPFVEDPKSALKAVCAFFLMPCFFISITCLVSVRDARLFGVGVSEDAVG